MDDWLNVLSVYDEDEQPKGLAIIVPWDEQKREVFNTRFRSAQSANFDATHLLDAQKHNVDPFQVTRVILKEDFLPILPKGVSKVWAVAAYPSASEYEKDYTPDIRQERQETLGMALAHKFLAPKPTGKSERELLVQSVKLAKRDDFKEKRSQLYKWQENIIQEDIPADKAVVEMERYLKQYNAIVRRAVRKVYWKFAFTVVPVGLSIVGASLINPWILTGGLVTLARFAKLDRRPDIQAGDCDAAAMFHDAHKRLPFQAG